MMEHLIQIVIKHLVDVIVAVVSYLLGLLTMNIYMKKDKSRTSTKQTGNVVIGNQAGRDIRK